MCNILEIIKKLLKKNIPDKIKEGPSVIIVHHSAGDGDFFSVNNWHQKRWNFRSRRGFYCGYQYFIERSGKVYQARSDFEEGAHTLGENRDSIGICLQGNGDVRSFTKKQYKSFDLLVKEKIKQYPIREVNGHRDYQATACPSDELYNYIKDEYNKI